MLELIINLVKYILFKIITTPSEITILFFKFSSYFLKNLFKLKFYEVFVIQGFDNREGKIWLNGKLVEWNDSKIHVLNHGLHYASSVFEGKERIMVKSLNPKNTLKDSLRVQTMDMEIPLHNLKF